MMTSCSLRMTVIPVWTLVFLVASVSTHDQQILDKQDEILKLLKGQTAKQTSIEVSLASLTRIVEDQTAKQALIEDSLASLKRIVEGGFCSNNGMHQWQSPNLLPVAPSIPCPNMLEDAAFGKTTFISSVHDEDSRYVAEKAVDGNDNTYFSTKLEMNPWWLVDLRSERTIYHIIIYVRNDCCPQKYHDVEIRIGDLLQVDGDFSSYKLLNFYKGPYSLDQGRLMYTFCTGTTGRYLSVKIVKEVEENLFISNFQVIALRN